MFKKVTGRRPGSCAHPGPDPARWSKDGQFGCVTPEGGVEENLDQLERNASCIHAGLTRFPLKYSQLTISRLI